MPFKVIELGNSISFKTVFAPSDDSDQPTYLCSLISVFMGTLWVAKDPNRLRQTRKTDHSAWKESLLGCIVEKAVPWLS